MAGGRLVVASGPVFLTSLVLFKCAVTVWLVTAIPIRNYTH